MSAEPVRFAHHGRGAFALGHPDGRHVTLVLHFEHSNTLNLLMSSDDARRMAAALLGAAKIADQLVERAPDVDQAGVAK